LILPFFTHPVLDKTLISAIAGTMKPTFDRLKDAGDKGLFVRNPDNGLVFRAVYATWKNNIGLAVLHTVRIFDLGNPVEIKSPLMNPWEIEQWLNGLESWWMIS
jgi:hypothetical protein